MKKLILFVVVIILLSSLAFQASPYARRIRPFSSTPVACQENEIGYNMTTHALVICTNAGYQALTTGASGSFAPSNATYITQTTNATLTNEQALSALATGLVKNTTTTGILSIGIAGTDYENPLTFDSPLSRLVNTISCPTCALTSGNLSQFAATTSAQLFGIISDESGAAGVLMKGNFTSLTADDILKWDGTNWINAIASGGGGAIGSGNVNMTLSNEGVTGTTVDKLVKITGAPSTAIISAISDTDSVVGVCTSGCGNTGTATIAVLGQVQCVFDGATTAGNFVVNSDATAGNCEDAGSTFPIDRAAIGRVLSTNVGAGTYTMELMTPDIAFQNAGNGKSKPAGSSTEFQYRNGNQFGAGNLFREDANTVAQRNGITTQIFQLYDEFTSASNYQRLQFHKNAGSQFEIFSTNQTQGAMELAFKVNGASGALILGTSNLRPATTRLYNLGESTSNQFNQLFIFRIDLNGDGLFFTSGPQLVSGGGGWLQMRDSASGANLTRISLGDTGASGVSIVKPASSTFIEAKNGDNSAYIPFAASNFKTGANNLYISGTPSISGDGTLNTNSKDSAGKVTSTATGAASIVLTFSTAFQNAPACFANNETTANLTRATSTTTQVTLAGTTVTSDVISYTCIGY